MDVEIETMVTGTIVKWIKKRLEGDTPPRLNLRFVFGDQTLALGVKAALEAENGAGPYHFMVRRSSDPDAVRLRHGTPADTPPGTTVVYILFWQPGTSEHERNAQSLTDLRAVEVSEVLARSESFVLDAEQAILDQCDEASKAWKDQHQARAREHLHAAWDGLRTCIRERRGGRQGSIAFAPRIDSYCRFLLEARIRATDWTAMPPEQRAAALLKRWGEALPALGLFTLPALGSVLGVRTRPDDPEKIQSAKRTRELSWPDVLAQVLAENVEYAVDFSALEDALAGKKTLQEQLDVLAARVPLCQDPNPKKRDEARLALERFCHDGDESALRTVEWLFRQDGDNRRSASHGLKGLLLARGRGAPAPDPLERATSETTAMFDALVGADAPDADVLRGFVAQQRASVTTDSKNAAVMAETLLALAGGAAPDVAGAPETVAVFARVAAAPGKKPEVLQRLAHLWSGLIAKQTEKPVEAPTLLLGLARLLAQRAGEEPEQDGRLRIAGASASDVLVLSLARGGENDCRIEFPVNDWGPATLERLATWAQKELRTAVFSDTDAEAGEDQDPDERDDLTIEVRRRSGNGAPKPIGLLTLYWSPRARRMWRDYRPEVPTSWMNDVAVGDTVPAGHKLTRALQQTLAVKARAEAPASEAVGATWQAYVKSVGSEAGWEVGAMIAPVNAAARECVEAWASAIDAAARGAGGAGVAKRREELQAELSRALTEGRFPDAQRINSELTAMPQAVSTAGPALMNEARSLLRLGTVSFNESGQPKVVAMTPHHPLSLRLRAVSDRALADVLQLLWTDGWSAVAHEDLVEALRSWGAPEPIHAYGYWDGDPLVFDGWLEGGIAVFTRLGSGRALDATLLGTREVGRVLGRYGVLFPASADRLKLRVRGDNHGRWAWQILDDRLGSPEFRADVDLVTSLGPREQTAVEQAVYSGREATDAFELGPEGGLPRVRVRRQRDLDPHPDAIHLALLVGDQIDAFQPTWDRAPRPQDPAAVALWDTSILFTEPSPALRGYSFSIGDANDVLSGNVARVVGLACGATSTVFTERYTFDPTRCEGPLRQQQGNAHWLVLASRQPLYRAVQQAGDKIATLLDFYTFVERGRSVHVCVSLNSLHATEDLKRLDGALAELLRGSAASFSGSALVSAALRLAPGLAMRCAAATGAAQLGGLLGLLLTGAALRAARPDAIVLSLDQHQSLLGGQGRLGDLLVVRQGEGAVRIAVGESKFTTGSVDPTSGPAEDAARQVDSSIIRLAHLAETHPVSLRARNHLVRALAHQVHMAPCDDAQLASAEALIEAVRDPRVPIIIEPASAASIHVWSVADDTVDVETPGVATSAVNIHGRKSTLKYFAELATDGS